ncbi:MAG: hypothetical protein JWM65_2233 [Sphingomonas bacterium]|nr:hypothetical protein [Sphingomonas bacterium]
MTLDVRGVFRDAWAMWQRDRGVLIAITGVFLFLPQLALFLFGPDDAWRAAMVAAQKLKGDAQAEALTQLYIKVAPLLFVGTIATVFGVLTVLMLYFDSAKRDVGGILVAALRRFPAYFALTLIVQVPAIVAVYSLYLMVPALYVVGRLLLAGPIFVASGLGPIDAIAGSVRMTRGHGLILAGFATLIIFAGQWLPQPAIELGNLLDRAPLANPVSGLIIDAIAAALVTAAMLGGMLIRIALYRRIGASNGI